MIYKDNFWTSDLIVYTHEQIDLDDLKSSIEIIKNKIEALSSFNPNSVVNNFNNKLCTFKYLQNYMFNEFGSLSTTIIEFGSYKKDGTYDFTGMLKGWFISLLSTFLYSKCKSFYVNFGGDIYSHDISMKIRLENSNFYINKSGSFCIFTSGNNDKRGNHILSSRNDKSTTIIMNNMDPIKADMLSTIYFSGGSNLIDFSKITKIHRTFDDKFIIDGKTYCASPFFNEEECKIRDEMISKLVQIHRPDELDKELRYDSARSEELASKIVNLNIEGIEKCESLIFPKYTKDIGTLFEIGYAYKLRKSIIRFDPITKDYELLDNIANLIPTYADELINCAKLTGPICIGYNYPNKNLKYTIGNLNDNIMLRCNYKRMELNNGRYEEFKSNLTDSN